MMVARVTDLALTCALIVVRDEFIVAGTGIVDAQVRGLRGLIPAVKIRLIVRGNDRVKGGLGGGRRHGPTLAWQSSATGRGACATAPDPPKECNPDAELGGRFTGVEHDVDHTVG